MELRRVLPAFFCLLTSRCGAPASQASSGATTQPPSRIEARSAATAGDTSASSEALDVSSAEGFTRTVAARITLRVTGAAVAGTAPLTLRVQINGGDQLEVSLDRIWRVCRAVPVKCDSEVTLLEGALRDSTAPEPLAADRLFAVVRPAGYVDEMRKRNAAIVAEPLAADLVVVYMVDVGSRARIATDADFTKLGIDRKSAVKRARDNTARKLGPLEARLKHDSEAVACIARHEYYESSALLETAALSDLVKKSGKLVASVPSADTFCYAWKSDAPTVAALRSASEALFKSAERPLSTTLLEWSAAGWREVSKR